MRISGVLLAAGKSGRMGKNKLLLPFGKRTVIEESLIQLTESGLDEVLVITGFQHERVRKVIDGKYGDSIKAVYNENYESGRAESIKCAIRNLDPASDAVLFMVADKPSVKSDLIRKAIDEFRKKTPLILYIQTPTGRGHPVIFSRAVFGDFMELGGEPAGNDIIEKYKDSSVIIEDRNPQIDIDTVDDYRRILKESAK
jgi:molybdenum cofactor cytidylyltransferase